MIPSIELLNTEITEQTFPSRTYNVIIEKGRISGYADDLEAVKQSAYFILSTERYKYPIYSWDYGVELVDLIGKPVPYVMSEIPRRVTEALTQDNRVQSVTDFEFTKNGKRLHVSFTVTTDCGDLHSALEVEI